jgi:hypothetical protein
MSAHRLLSGLAVWCALGLFGGSASGQLAVIPVQGLTFGLMTAGVPLTVTSADAARRAEFTISQPGSYVLTFTLPTQLVSGTGQTMPITFAADSGLIVWNRSGGPQTKFDPAIPRTLSLPKPSNGARVYLGGTAAPTSTQAPGDYTATVLMVVANAGT